MNGLLGAFRYRTVVWSSALVALSLAAAALGGPGAASAQRRGRPTPPVAPVGPSAEQTAAARTAYGEGQRLFREGQFAQAQTQFEAAFTAVPNPVVLLSVAEAQERQSNIVDAVATLERYLTLRADAPDRAAVQARIDQMRTRPGVLAISSEPSGAAITLDGTATGRVTPAEIETPAGEHTISVSLDGYEPGAQSVSVTFGLRQEVSVPALTTVPVVEELTAGEGEGEGEGEAEEEEDDDSGPGAGVWVAAGIGAAGLVAGTVLGFLALSEQSDFDTTPTEASADRGERLALFADVGFGVAAVGFLTALVLNFATGGDDDEGEAEEPATTARLRVTPVVGPSGGGITARLTF